MQYKLLKIYSNTPPTIQVGDVITRLTTTTFICRGILLNITNIDNMPDIWGLLDQTKYVVLEQEWYIHKESAKYQKVTLSDTRLKNLIVDDVTVFKQIGVEVEYLNDLPENTILLKLKTGKFVLINKKEVTPYISKKIFNINKYTFKTQNYTLELLRDTTFLGITYQKGLMIPVELLNIGIVGESDDSAGEYHHEAVVSTITGIWRIDIDFDGAIHK